MVERFTFALLPYMVLLLRQMRFVIRVLPARGIHLISRAKSHSIDKVAGRYSLPRARRSLLPHGTPYRPQRSELPVSTPHSISGEETEIDRKRLLLDARSGGELDSHVARYEFSAVFVAHGTQQTLNRNTLRHIAANSVFARFAEGHKFGKSSS